MREFFDLALGFPAVLLSFGLLVVILYWLIVLIGMLDIDVLDGDSTMDGHSATEGQSGADGDGADSPGGFAGLLSAIGLGGVPVTVVMSLLIAFSWFVGLAGTALIDSIPTVLQAILGVVILVIAVIVAWTVTRVLVAPLRKLFPDEPSASHQDFVGRMCTIRTGKVTTDFGQAEAVAADGSTVVIQVRQNGEENFTRGSVALIFQYDGDGVGRSRDGGVFWVMSPPAFATGELDPEEGTER